MGDSIATLADFIASPEQGVLDVQGTPVTLSRLETINSDAAMFFGYVRGIPSIDLLGPLTPIVLVVFFSFALSWFTGAIKFALPLVGAVIGLIRRLIEFIITIYHVIRSLIPFI